MQKLIETETAIFIRDLWVRFDQQIVLENIDLTVAPKEIVTIIGPNGSGKTTLLNTILGFKTPYRGEIRVFGEEPKKLERNGMIGFLPQNNPTDVHFPVSVFDVVAMSRYGQKRFWERLESKDRVEIESVLERVEMSEFSNMHFGSLSGGQKQRVLIARALALEPQLLILDEPSTGLDAVAQDRFYHLLQELRDRDGLTILLVSHDIGVVSGIVDTIACLNRRIHFHGKPEDCIPSDALRQVFGKDVRFVFHDAHCQTCEKNT